ncbi:unnamed protein product [Rangifer tarandus platyrhynchus]|uniref:Uncharacterized protein n=2 Tax=Rangifer tarandus platyrhynchus TaxID=3082113 RepID=A0ABN8ZS01_RANTA|nr:unnamed protein product [Rangifer tarandus platyrhynchus]CAI9711134.1 unnamed protein product [Rangifer tarandus platyrhynchus]
MPAHPSPGLRKAETALASSVACWAPDAMARAEGPALPGPWPGLLEPKTAGARRPGWGPLPPSLSGPGSASLDPKGCVGHLHNRGAAASFPLFISACCFILWVSGLGRGSRAECGSSMRFPEPCGELSRTVNETVARAGQLPAGGLVEPGRLRGSRCARVTWPSEGAS